MKLPMRPVRHRAQAPMTGGARKPSPLMGGLKLLLAAFVGMTLQLSPVLAGVLVAQDSGFICGDSTLGARTLHLSGDLRPGGVCVAGNGYITGLPRSEGWDKLELDSVYSTSNGEGGDLRWTIDPNESQGQGQVARDAWKNNRQVLLGIRFYDASTDASPSSGYSPDLFFVELLKPSVAGAWSNFTFALQNSLAGATRQLGLFETDVEYQSHPAVVNVSAPSSAALLVLGLMILSIGRVRRRVRLAGPQG